MCKAVSIFLFALILVDVPAGLAGFLFLFIVALRDEQLFCVSYRSLTGHCLTGRLCLPLAWSSVASISIAAIHSPLPVLVPILVQVSSLHIVLTPSAANLSGHYFLPRAFGVIYAVNGDKRWLKACYVELFFTSISSRCRCSVLHHCFMLCACG